MIISRRLVTASGFSLLAGAAGCSASHSQPSAHEHPPCRDNRICDNLPTIIYATRDRKMARVAMECSGDRCQTS